MVTSTELIANRLETANPSTSNIENLESLKHYENPEVLKLISNQLAPEDIHELFAYTLNSALNFKSNLKNVPTGNLQIFKEEFFNLQSYFLKLRKLIVDESDLLKIAEQIIQKNTITDTQQKLASELSKLNNTKKRLEKKLISRERLKERVQPMLDSFDSFPGILIPAIWFNGTFWGTLAMLFAAFFTWSLLPFLPIAGALLLAGIISASGLYAIEDGPNFFSSLLSDVEKKIEIKSDKIEIVNAYIDENSLSNAKMAQKILDTLLECNEKIKQMSFLKSETELAEYKKSDATPGSREDKEECYDPGTFLPSP